MELIKDKVAQMGVVPSHKIQWDQIMSPNKMPDIKNSMMENKSRINLDLIDNSSRSKKEVDLLKSTSNEYSNFNNMINYGTISAGSKSINQ